MPPPPAPANDVIVSRAASTRAAAGHDDPRGRRRAAHSIRRMDRLFSRARASSFSRQPPASETSAERLPSSSLAAAAAAAHVRLIVVVRRLLAGASAGAPIQLGRFRCGAFWRPMNGLGARLAAAANRRPSRSPRAKRLAPFVSAGRLAASGASAAAAAVYEIDDGLVAPQPRTKQSRRQQNGSSASRGKEGQQKQLTAGGQLELNGRPLCLCCPDSIQNWRPARAELCLPLACRRA